eukprot:492226-Hanusia_phi.AAC.1
MTRTVSATTLLGPAGLSQPTRHEDPRFNHLFDGPVLPPGPGRPGVLGTVRYRDSGFFSPRPASEVLGKDRRA